ncbi:MFS transporter [Mucilaginibacter sp. SMC90]|uniref:MFS transporter n=1 Tax=Mucilaginibacter sp. SMC90 TaxID=2929803 RepID=UPI001FB34FC6|nr:MFS transporter [Mucilaginibacter sp. SMC90]UOE46524.1 MFS transporter [Mucilaginibacter sp. SMC90]
MDRSNISVAATAISTDLKLSTVEIGLIFSAFGWTYVAFQIPGGIIIDRFSPRVLYAISLCSWSVVTLLQGVVRGFYFLLGLRMATGMFEAPSYPINNRVVTQWFPENERASAIAVYTSGQFIGLAFLTPLLAVIQNYWGWRGLFISTGLVGIAWSVVWYCFYRNPVTDDALRGAESKATNIPSKKITAAEFKQVLTNRKLWGIYLGQFAVTSTLWFFLTWFPTYLVKYRGFDFLKSGFLSSIPFLAAFAGVLLSGLISDGLIKKGISLNKARKTPVIVGLLLSTFIIGANFVNNTSFVILFMAIAFFGNGLASIAWVFVSLLSPKNLIGLTGGVFNFMGGLSSIIVPLVIGYLAKNGSFTSSILFIGILAFAGVLSYVFLVGDVGSPDHEKNKLQHNEGVS